MNTLELSGDDWGHNVTRHRKRNGLTMRQLAQRAGLGTGTILRLEQSKAARKDTLVAVARALGCDNVLIPVPPSEVTADSESRGIPCSSART